MNRRFRLATLERLRTVRLDRAGTELREAAERLRTTIADRDRVLAELLAASAPAVASPEDVQIAGHRRTRLREEHGAAVAAVQTATEALAEAQAAWIQARVELRAVEMLHERHREETRRETARREQRETDELAGLRSLDADLREPGPPGAGPTSRGAGTRGVLAHATGTLLRGIDSHELRQTHHDRLATPGDPEGDDAA
jgi:flagellar export protein FliJ